MQNVIGNYAQQSTIELAASHLRHSHHGYKDSSFLYNVFLEECSPSSSPWVSSALVQVRSLLMQKGT